MLKLDPFCKLNGRFHLLQSPWSSDARLNALFHVKVPLCLMDVDSLKILWANEPGLTFWQADNASELYARDMAQSLTTAAIPALHNIRRNCHATQSCVSELWTVFPGEQATTAQIGFSPYLTDDNKPVLLLQVIKQHQSRRAESLHTTTALTHTSTMISLYGNDNQLLFSNSASQDALGNRERTLLDRWVNPADIHKIEQALIASESCSIELEVHTVAGIRWHSMSIRRSLNAVSGDTATLVSATDSTEQRNAQQVAYNLAYTDSLTNLPNRAAINIYLDELMAPGEKSQTGFGLFFLDLDRFKAVNDSLGHSVGDQLLIEVALRLTTSAGPDSMVARLGGDEFVMIINRVTDIKILCDLATSVLQCMSEPVELNEQKLRILPSIGICSYPANGNTISELMQNADAAMYLAKANQSGYYFYDETMTRSLSEGIKNRLGLENDLVSALSNNEFELYYQPKISCRTRAVTGAEALLRWNHPTRGMIPPDHFIAIAEETGQIIELGNWVLHEAMKQQRDWHRAGFNLPVSINISARQFKATDLVSNVSEALIRHCCDPVMVELEITESMLLGDTDHVHETLHQLSTMGIKLALDDFGTGYSNLAYLQRYPLDTLKIDKAFLADQKRSMLMGTILNMGKVLGLQVVAEGVETAAQADWLIARGCDYLQGFHFSKPLPVAQATEFFEQNSATRQPPINKAA